MTDKDLHDSLNKKKRRKREYVERKLTEKSLLFDRLRGDGGNFMEDGFGAA